MRPVLETLAWMGDRGSSVDALAQVLDTRELRVALTLAMLADVGLVRYNRGKCPEARITPLGIAALTATPRPIVLHGVLDWLIVNDDVVDAVMTGTDGRTRLTARMDIDDVRVIAALACRRVKVTIEIEQGEGASTDA